MTEPVDDARRAQLAERLTGVRGRIAAACAAAGRDPGEVTLVVVTKTYPAGDIRRLQDARALGHPAHRVDGLLGPGLQLTYGARTSSVEHQVWNYRVSVMALAWCARALGPDRG